MSETNEYPEPTWKTPSPHEIEDAITEFESETKSEEDDEE